MHGRMMGGSRLRLDASLFMQLLGHSFGELGGGLIGALSCGWGHAAGRGLPSEFSGA